MTQTGNPGLARILLGGVTLAIAALGIYSLTDAIIDVVRAHFFFFDTIEIGFGVFSLFVVYRSWFFRTTRSVRWLCILAGFMVFIILSAKAFTTYKKIFGDWPFNNHPRQPDIGIEPIESILMMLAAIMTMLMYRLTIRWFLTRLNLIDDRTYQQRLSSVKWSIGLAAWLLWTTAEQCTRHLRPLPGNHNVGPDLLDGITIFGPVVVAVAVYKIGVYVATRKIRKTPLQAAMLPAASINSK